MIISITIKNNIGIENDNNLFASPEKPQFETKQKSNALQFINSEVSINKNANDTSFLASVINDLPKYIS